MDKTIVVGVDGSPRTAGVVAAAVSLARPGTKLHFVRAVLVPMGVPPSAWTLEGGELVDYLLRHAKDELEAATTQVDPALMGAIVVRLGNPADVVCSLATEVGADLVVIGSHGYGGIDRLLGTTAAKIVNRAPCSVHVVRPREA